MKSFIYSLVMFCVLQAQAQLSGIDFNKYSIGEIKGNNSSAVLKCDVFYDTLIRGNLVKLNNIKAQWQLILPYNCKINKDAPLRLKLMSDQTGMSDWGEIIFFSKDYKVNFDNTVTLTLNRNAKRFRGPESLSSVYKLYYYLFQEEDSCPNKGNELDMINDKKIREYLKERLYAITLSENRSKIVYEIEKALRHSISGKATPIKVENVQSESVFCDFILAADKKDNVTLNVMASDGKLLASYNLDAQSVPFGENADTYIHNLIQELLNKFFSDTAMVEKINNLKETMQNTYRNDEERTQQLVYELQFYIKERTNR